MEASKWPIPTDFTADYTSLTRKIGEQRSAGNVHTSTNTLPLVDMHTEAR